MSGQVIFKNSPKGITANKLNKRFLQSGGGGGGGDMSKSVYDTDGNGIVDTADSISWSKVTGKPTALGDMTKAIYDANNDGISDHAALADHAAVADSVPWAGITGKPALTDPGVWTALSVYQTGWSESATARYRLETRSSGDKAVFFKGAIVKALTSSAILALVLPSTLRPAQTRSCMVAGAQTEDGGDFCNYIVTIYSSGNVEIRPLVKYPFTWTILSDTHTVYLDGLRYEL